MYRVPPSFVGTFQNGILEKCIMRVRHKNLLSTAAARSRRSVISTNSLSGRGGRLPYPKANHKTKQMNAGLTVHTVVETARPRCFAFLVGTNTSFSGPDSNHLLNCCLQVLVAPDGYCLPPTFLGFGNVSTSKLSAKPVARQTHTW